MRRTLSSVAVTAVVVAAFVLGISLAGNGTQPAGADTTLARVRAELMQSYYRPVPANVLRQPSIGAMLRALHDPYTEYLDPTELRLLDHETSSSYNGIGVGVLPVPSGLKIVRTKPGPASAAGLRRGDVITSIDGAPIAGVPLERALRFMFGAEGTSLHLGIARGSNAFELAIVRERLSAPPVHSKLLAIGKLRVGYAKLATFRIGAAPVLASAVAKLRRANVAGLVLDLRGNPGGRFEQAIAVASLFLDKGVIVTLDGSNGEQAYSANAKLATRLPLVVLVDRDSASAAEIVAAALHDNRRAILVGEHTFGKAVVQELRPLPNGAALKLTTARYLTPAGVDITSRGVHPDLVARDVRGTREDEALTKALELFLR